MKHILIIEDDLLFAELIGDTLKEGDFSFSLAKGGKEGLKKFSEEKYDLILLDIVMPGMDGFEVLKEIRKREEANPELTRTPVIFLTNLGQKEEVEKGLRIGADAYIIKTKFSSKVLYENIRRNT